MKNSLLIALIATAALAGCANQRFTVAGNGAGGAPRMEDSQAFFVSGIGQKSQVDAGKVCGGADKVDTVDVERTGLDVILGVVTLGIYTPATARVYCK